MGQAAGLIVKSASIGDLVRNGKKDVYMHRQRSLSLLLLLLTSLLTACSEQAAPMPVPDPTLLATSTSMPVLDPTLTATLTPLAIPTFIPVPTLSGEAGVNPASLIAGDLAFLSLQGEEVWLYTVAVNGSGLTKISEVTSWDQPQWSPDGKALAFRGKEVEDMSSLYVIQESDSAPVRVTTGMDVGSYTWSPEGDRLAFSAVAEGQQDIYLLSLDTLALTNVTSSQDVFEWEPVWAPTGTQIAFYSTLVDSVNLGCAEECREIHLMDTADMVGHHQIKVELDSLYGGGECNPTWSPDGRYLAFIQGCTTVGNWVPCLFDSQTGSTSRLVTDQNLFSAVWEVDWISEDELSLLYLYRQNDRLYAINKSGEDLRPLFPEANLDKTAGSWTGDHRFYAWHDRTSYELLIGDMTTGQSVSVGIKGCDPVWSPADDWLAFTTTCLDELVQQSVPVARRNGSRVYSYWKTVGAGDIEVMHQDGSGLLNLTLDVPGGSFQPFWKP